ncbi:hypothetical protein [Blastococcus sp. SYSU D00695]
MPSPPRPVRDAGAVPPDEQGEPSGAPRGRNWPAVVWSTVLVAGVFTLLFLRNHRFAYIDDRQADGVAKLVDMGRVLESGEWPWLSTQLVNSGGYAVEYQNGVFNPVNLAFGVLMGHLDDAALGSYLQLLFHLAVLAAAAAWLGRSLGLTTPWAVAFAVSVGLGPYTLFWSGAWYQVVVSFSWLVLAVAAAVAFHLGGRRRHGWSLLVATYLCNQSGWPLALVALGLFVVVLVAARLLTRADRGRTAWLAAWYGGGVLTSLIGLYPLLVSFRFASRSSSVSNGTNANVAPLEGLLHAADPAYHGWFVNFDGYGLQDLPHFYVAWFVLPVLVFWRPGPGLRQPHVRALLVTAAGMLAVTALAALGPERVLVFRFPTRFLQYSGLFLLMVVALLVGHGRFSLSRRRVAVLAGLIGVQVLTAVQADPAGVVRVVGLNAGVAALCLAMLVPLVADPARRPRLPRRLPAARASGCAVAAGTVLVMVVLAWQNPIGRGSDWGFPHDLTTVETLSQRDYTLWFGGYAPVADADELPSPADAVAGYYAEYHPSSTGLLVGDRQVNGYSPLGHRYLRAHLPIDDHGNFDAADGARLFTAVDPATGRSWLELLRVDQVVAPLGAYDEALRRELDASWRRAEVGRYTATYRRVEPYRLPGLVSSLAPGVAVDPEESCPRRHSRECVPVRNGGDDAGRVVFARLWFPGYSATLDGEPLDVVAHDGTLVAVDLPPGAEGGLVLSYRSPGFVPLAALAVATVVGLAAVPAVQRVRRRRAGRAGAGPALPA